MPPSTSTTPTRTPRPAASSSTTKAYGITKVAEPIGIVGAVIPTTNPTSTAIFKCLICLKTRNAIIISPHPAAAQCTIAAAKLVLEAAVKAGAPEGIIGWIDKPTLELTNKLMSEVDIILATGGPGMVKSAYSSGKPALGVGAGNTPVVIDETADILNAVNSIIHSKTFDNGMICASEQSVTALDSVYDQVKAEFQRRGCYFVKKGKELEALREAMFKNGALDHRIPGMPAAKIAELAGIEVPGPRPRSSSPRSPLPTRPRRSSATRSSPPFSPCTMRRTSRRLWTRPSTSCSPAARATPPRSTCTPPRRRRSRSSRRP